MFATWQQSQVNMDGLTVSEGMFVLLPGTIYYYLLKDKI